MFEVFSEKDIQEVRDANRLIVSHDNEPYCVDDDVLKEIFYHVNSFSDVLSQRDKIVKKSTHVVAEISYNQPFCEGNRRTSFYVLKSFLGRNGFTIRFYSIKEKEEFADLLRRTAKEKFEGDPTIYSKVERYLERKIEPVKFDYL